jgi:hypothetical protein
MINIKFLSLKFLGLLSLHVKDVLVAEIVE